MVTSRRRWVGDTHTLSLFLTGIYKGNCVQALAYTKSYFCVWTHFNDEIYAKFNKWDPWWFESGMQDKGDMENVQNSGTTSLKTTYIKRRHTNKYVGCTCLYVWVCSCTEEKKLTWEAELFPLTPQQCQAGCLDSGLKRTGLMKSQKVAVLIELMIH